MREAYGTHFQLYLPSWVKNKFYRGSAHTLQFPLFTIAYLYIGVDGMSVQFYSSYSIIYSLQVYAILHNIANGRHIGIN